MEVLKYQVPTGKWILVDPDPITHSVRPHVPSDVLWTISEGVAVRPDQHGTGLWWVWHHRTCRAVNPTAAQSVAVVAGAGAKHGTGRAGGA
ncbi:hypothetical protein Shyd_56630 [Streptomyces hydrogenans]|uniref:Transposase n=2 Tax=Streptomyces hydrogenans TaxID=1873719 RepID=A0ABQ3PGY7_9ACTN|nr:hypothetical protein Shyd_56630 [Streptomyces hydrogenans]